MKAIKWIVYISFTLIIAGCQLMSLVKPEPTSIPAHPKPDDPANADPDVVSINQLPLTYPQSDDFKFMVIGHIYGTTIGEDREPSPTLLANIDKLNSLNLTMVVSLGDMVKHSEPEDFNILETKVLTKLKSPIFNTVGNHDLVNRELYENRYGQTYYSFAVGPAQMIFLDTERVECQIDDVQSKMINNVVSSALQNDAIKNIFIFMHKTLFFKNDNLFQKKLRMAGPNVWDCYGSESFSDIFETIIKPASLTKPIYLFAGDVGAWGNLSPYYEKLENFPITLVMSGIGEEPNDSVILVNVSQENVELELMPLTDTPMMSLESYNPGYWESVK